MSMSIYNPLDRNTELFTLYESSDAQGILHCSDAELCSRYRGHAIHLYADRDLGSIPAVITGDGRRLTGALGHFLPALVGTSDLPLSLTEDIQLVFPKVSVSDARVDTAGKRRVAYITSGKLDAIELFANTVSLCTRLNQLALPVLIEESVAPQSQIPIAWLTVTGDVRRGHTVNELLIHAKNGYLDSSSLLRSMGAPATHLWPSFYRFRLSHYLMQLMMRRIRRSENWGWDNGSLLQKSPTVPSPIDGDYLAVLTLAFVVLHEIGHHLLRHNEIGFHGFPHEIALSEFFRKSVISVAGSDATFGTPGSVGPFEQGADDFALEIVDQSLREPLLEAASLWIAAHERTHVAAGNRFDDMARMMDDPNAHPSPALRVWHLNGRFSAGIRRGEIARRIAAQAEGAAAEPGDGLEDAGLEAAVYQSMWEDAVTAAAD